MSGLPFELLLVIRYLRPKRTFFSIITLISIVGVMLGVAVLIIVISVMSGFDRELRDKIIGFNAHLRVSTDEGSMRDFSEVAQTVKKNPAVKAAAPYIMGQVMIETQPEFGEPVWLAQVMKGVDPKIEGTVSVLPKSVVEGSFDLRGNGLLIGRGLADNLRLKVGDKLGLYGPRELRKIKKTRKDPDSEAYLADEYVIRGIFDLGYSEYNASFVITSLANAQDLYELDDRAHGLVVMLDDPYLAERVRGEVGKELGFGFKLTTWFQENSTFLTALFVEKKVMFYLLFFIIIVAAFGIANAQITFVVQKTREIGMLKALGASRTQIMSLFLSQGLIVGLFGVVSGVGLGLLAVSYRNEFLRMMDRFTGFQLFPADIYSFSELPAVVSGSDIAIICGLSLFICLLAGLVPAWNAGRLKPVEALRRE